MRFVVLGDIHSNKFALESVLKDIAERNVDFIVSTGDLVGYLPFPNEVIEMIRSNKVLVVKGNHDKHVAESNALQNEEINKMSDEQIQNNASSAFTNWIIKDEYRMFLNHLPLQLVISCNGLKTIIVHGSPESIDEYLFENSERVFELSKTIDADILICGHTHIPFHQKIEGKHFINAGSVGKPKHGGPQATYVIVDVEANKVEAEVIKVDYDMEGIIKTIKSSRMISNKLIQMLQDGY